MFRHTAVYGGVYAIGDVAFCLGFAIGKQDGLHHTERIYYRAIGPSIFYYICISLCFCLQSASMLQYCTCNMLHQKWY